MFDLSDGNSTQLDRLTARQGPNFNFTAMAFSPDGDKLSIGNVSKLLSIYPFVAGKLQRVPSRQSGAEIPIAMAFPDENHIIRVDAHTVTAFNISTRDFKLDFSHKPPEFFSYQSLAVATFPKGGRDVTYAAIPEVGNGIGQVQLDDAQSAAELNTLNKPNRF